MGQTGKFEILDTLIEYYQMETRTELRILLLRVFAAIGKLDEMFLPFLQNSVLPIELGRELVVAAASPERKPKLPHLLPVLTAMFACGHRLPAQHFEHLNFQFVTALLDLIELGHESLSDEKIATGATNALIGFNLHFTTGTENTVVGALDGRVCESLAQHLVQFLNRGVDPLSPTRGGKESRGAGLKLLMDIFGSATVGKTFMFTSDLNVMLDVLIRELTDRDHGDETRTHLFVRTR